MNVFLWVLQGILAAMFLMAGVMKTTQSKEKLLEKLPWVEDYSTGTVRFIGTAEFLGAIGLILPAALDIAPILTPLAATGLAITMLLAMNAHRRRHEPGAIAFPGVLFVVAAFVAVARFGPWSF
ncbi:DoxX family protein [Actinomadura verrucosospora]|uniref:Putative membrane protein YphA (DoxX/SURF4 family) n=1 Tax=Actinomadura luteofluorescens TaxID=46163 RepID=A0A7Y9EFT0_9ACTN|nr:DoxX family protein [Actinomadura luteofluorescens]NYD46595.1 putative membrane protein YphA (DoxX/SURF4 family) [Actinomadura luteofluorescens]